MFISVYMDCKECWDLKPEVAIISSPVYIVDKIGLLNFFQAEKRQQMRQAGQRLIEMDCILCKRVWI